MWNPSAGIIDSEQRVAVNYHHILEPLGEDSCCQDTCDAATEYNRGMPTLTVHVTPP